MTQEEYESERNVLDQVRDRYMDMAEQNLANRDSYGNVRGQGVKIAHVYAQLAQVQQMKIDSLDLLWIEGKR